MLKTSPERGFYYHASKHSAGQPIVAGWSYQWITQLSWDPDSWTAPIDARRIRVHENTTDATLTASGPVSSVPHLSLEPCFRRSHGSLYKSLANGGVDTERLRDLLIANRPAGWPQVFAVDASTSRPLRRGVLA